MRRSVALKPAVQFLVEGIRELAARRAATSPGAIDLTAAPASAPRIARERVG